MSYYQDPYGFTDVIVGPLQTLWTQVALFVPRLVTALAVFILGLIVANGLGLLVEKIFDAIKLDKFLKDLGIEPYFQRAGLRLHASRFLGQLVFWFFVIVFLLAASEILQLPQVSAFLRDVLAYIPNIVVAVFMMLAAVLVANFLRRVVSAAVKSAELPSAHFLGTLTWWAVVVFGFMTALVQILPAGGAQQIIQTLVTGFIAMLALAGGLAFGLGGKEYATHLINKLRERTESS